MKFKFFLVVLILPVFSFSQTVKENASAFVQALLGQKYETAISYIDSSLQSKVPTATLAQIRDGLVQKLGDFKGILEVNQDMEMGHAVCYIYTAYLKDSLDIKTVFNKANKIVGFVLVTHKDFKKQAQNSYNIQSGNLTLPGTLLIANKNNLKKLVILVHGSGANDRDETIGQNKPFKDIAEGLLKAGISSYRYDKRTFVDPGSMPANATVDDEVTHDVLNIIHYFSTNDTFRNYKLYIIGHSLGALMAPRIAQEAKGKLTGVIMMAGPATSLIDLTLKQVTYLDSLFPSEQQHKALKAIQQQVHYMHSAAFNENSPADSLLFHQKASYWLSYSNYKPLQIIKGISIPFLILQGEKDYQVSMTDFNLWKKATKGKSNISFKSYPELSHLFMPSDGTPSPKDYEGAKHIPDYVITDIATWIKKNGQ